MTAIRLLITVVIAGSFYEGLGLRQGCAEDRPVPVQLKPPLFLSDRSVEAPPRTAVSRPAATPADFPQAVFPGIPVAPAAQAGTSLPLSISIGEGFLNRLLGTTDADVGPVVDYALGSHVYGQRWTASRLTIDVRPSAHIATADFVLHGTVDTDTQAINKDAVVSTLGHHRFQARKPVVFDGRRFATKVPDIWITPHNEITNVHTRFSDMPLMGPFADRIGRQVAETKKPDSERVAVDRVARNVLPAFNSGADRGLGDGNREWQRNVVRRLDQSDIWPEDFHVCSTSDTIRLSAGWGTTAVNPPAGPARMPATDGVIVSLHDSLPNGVTDRLNLNGQVIPLPRLLGRFSELLGDVETLIPAEQRPLFDMLQVRFPERDSLRFEFAADRLRITLRASFEFAGAAKPDYDEIVLSLAIDIGDETSTIRLDEAGVGPLAGGADGDLARIRRTAIRTQIESRFRPISFPSRRRLDLGEGRDTTIRLRNVAAHNGWLVVEAN